MAWKIWPASYSLEIDSKNALHSLQTFWRLCLKAFLYYNANQTVSWFGLSRSGAIQINLDLVTSTLAFSCSKKNRFCDSIHRYQHVMNIPNPDCSCGTNGLCTTSGAVLLVTVSFCRKVEKQDHAKSSRERRSKTKQNMEKALSAVCTYWLFRLDTLIAWCIWSLPLTVSNVRISSLFHSTPAIPNTRYT